MTTRHNACVVAATAMLLAVSTTQAATIHVDVANCPGPGDGSEADPYCSIQTAIDNAVDTDEIVVAPGTYFETIDFLGKAIWLHSSDGPEATIISANGPEGADSAVTCASGEEADTVLEGFALTDGTGTSIELPPDSGIFQLSGGGMYNDHNSSPTVTSCTFSGNSVALGGGMCNANNSSPTVTNCTFSGNTAFSGFGNGGGMFNHNSSPTVTNCTFSGNSAGFGGGGMANVDSSPMVTDCTFTGNSADEGGGMYNFSSNPTVTNCTFAGNQGYELGGGMLNDASNVPVTDCTFSGNISNYGGGLAYGETVTNCIFRGNSALLFGGGMYTAGSPTVTNCTFSENSAPNGHAFAIVGTFFPTGITLTNCILWDGGDETWTDGMATITINYSDVQGGFAGTGNINTDPSFVDPDNGNVRLQSGSPCIDAADNTAVPAGITTDLDGNPRFVDDLGTIDTGNGDPPIVDMGAYEFQGTSCPWDCEPTPNGNIGINDFLELLAQWGGPGSCDFDGGGVGINDFLDLLANWGPCP